MSFCVGPSISIRFASFLAMPRIFLFLSLLTLAYCRQQAAQPTQTTAPEVTLRAAASFPVGAAINPSLLTGKPIYR